jgi:hypothetical protein
VDGTDDVIDSVKNDGKEAVEGMETTSGTGRPGQKEK